MGLGMKSREDRVLHGEVRPEIAKVTIETERVEEEAEVFYDKVRTTDKRCIYNIYSMYSVYI